MAAHELSSPGNETTAVACYTDEELIQFESDDVSAGRSIAKILSMLFIYTVIAMLIVGWWTFKVLTN